MNILDAVQALKPGATFELSGTTYADLDWTKETVQAKPTEQEITDWLAANDYKEQRRKAYPYWGDQLDALWKGGQAHDDMKAIVDGVKTTYPKPS